MGSAKITEQFAAGNESCIIGRQKIVSRILLIAIYLTSVCERINGTVYSDKGGQHGVSQSTYNQSYSARTRIFTKGLKVESCLILKAVIELICPLTTLNPYPKQ